MANRRGKLRSHHDAWPVIADLFLAVLAVVVVMASGRQPLDNEVEQFKRAIVEKSRTEFSPVLADVEVRTKWVRLVLTEETLSFPKCQWTLPDEKQKEIQTLFRWIGTHGQLLRQIRIEGHADRKWQGIGCSDIGPFLDNLQLSQNRARAVYNVLLGFTPEERTGLYALLNDDAGSPSPPKGLEYVRDLAQRGCLEVAGYGDRHPRDKADPDSPKNRRVEVVLEFREHPASASPRGTVAQAAETTCEVSQQ
jgi:outer membrane protein OmpA-like peptidoglycan-associated protein